MNYELIFKEDAKKEWDKLDKYIQETLKKKLKERLVDPKVASAKLRGMSDCYKIKL
jgi:mRNA interferase RelE/StbE